MAERDNDEIPCSQCGTYDIPQGVGQYEPRLCELCVLCAALREAEARLYQQSAWHREAWDWALAANAVREQAEAQRDAYTETGLLPEEVVQLQADHDSWMRLEAAERGRAEALAAKYEDAEREWDSYTQMAEEELGKRNNRIAALESALALAKELWGTVPEEVFAKIDRALAGEPREASGG